MGDRILATVRTTVAAGVGYALVWLAREHGMVIDEDTSRRVEWAAMVVATAGYHAAASWVQRRWPAVVARWPHAGSAAGVVVALLLGSARQPTYPVRRVAPPAS